MPDSSPLHRITGAASAKVWLRGQSAVEDAAVRLFDPEIWFRVDGTPLYIAGAASDGLVAPQRTTRIVAWDALSYIEVPDA